MRPQRTILTHVGASALMRRQGKFAEATPALSEVYRDLSQGHRPSHSAESQAERVRKGLTAVWNYSSEKLRRKHSPAEIASLSMIGVGAGDEVHLLHSESRIGTYCAALLEAALSDPGIPADTGYPRCAPGQVKARALPGLAISDGEEGADGDGKDGADGDDFVRKGLVSYVSAVWGAYEELADGGQLIFNITAGYKGMVPIARDLAMLIAAHSRVTERAVSAELCYLYEDSSRLIRYAALPILLDWSSIPDELLERAGAPPWVDGREIPAEHQPLFEPADARGLAWRRSPLGELISAISTRVTYRPTTREERERIEARLRRLDGAHDHASRKEQALHLEILRAGPLARIDYEDELLRSKAQIVELEAQLRRLEERLGEG